MRTRLFFFFFVVVHPFGLSQDLGHRVAQFVVLEGFGRLGLVETKEVHEIFSCHGHLR